MSTILVVEDEHSLRKVISRSLLDAGHSPIEANNGKEVNELSSKKSVDAVILDLTLPIISGHVDIRTNPVWKKNLPVIVLTNSESQADIELVKKYHARYLHKVEVQIEDILSLLDQELKKWSKNAQN